jgi:5'-3' exonuclease
VFEKFGVRPASIPDYLALVGDAADGYPGIPGWGAKSAATVLARFEHLESIPKDGAQLGLGGARGQRLSDTLQAQMTDALLFRRLSTLRHDVPLRETVADLEWRGARPELKQICQQLGEKTLPDRVTRWRVE